MISATDSIEIKGISKCYKDGFVLKNISLKISKGEVVGIVGRNGAGKSTLLKILAGIVKPTTGDIDIYGSVTSILDVGTGFHPDLSGRENVRMVAKMQGFSAKEIEDRIPHIIAFSELESSIDHNVKTYSNGMYLRLAFSIYVFLNTDILLMDEILSVGDATFKSKSLRAIYDFKNQGKTIVLVTHNFNDVLNYCDRAIYLDTVVKGDSHQVREVIAQYLNDYPGEQKIFDPEWMHLDKKDALNVIPASAPNFYSRFHNHFFELLHLEMKTMGIAKSVFTYDEPINMVFTYRKKTVDKSLQLTVKIFDFNDVMLIASSAAFTHDYVIFDEAAGIYELTMKIPARFFNAGRFFITLIVSENKIMADAWHNIAAFEVQLEPWMRQEVWSNISSPLLPAFEWQQKLINGK